MLRRSSKYSWQSHSRVRSVGPRHDDFGWTPENVSNWNSLGSKLLYNDRFVKHSILRLRPSVLVMRIVSWHFEFHKRAAHNLNFKLAAEREGPRWAVTQSEPQNLHYVICEINGKKWSKRKVRTNHLAIVPSDQSRLLRTLKTESTCSSMYSTCVSLWSFHNRKSDSFPGAWNS